MHHALEIQEILLNIVAHCYSPGRRRYTASNLVSVARTCRAFKEPALDVLWKDLDDLSPLAQCLPEASHQLEPIPHKVSFTRPLTQIEWDILTSYTCRIRSVQNFNRGLDWESVTTFLNPPTTVPLFPNLRTLRCEYTENIMHLLHLPLPSLVSLDVIFENLLSLQSFPKFSPNISFSIRLLTTTFSRIQVNHVCRWKNLRSVVCPHFILDVDVLVYLSRMPALTRLDFMLSTTFPTSESPLFFPNLHDLKLQSKSLEAISRLLSQALLPAITDFVIVGNCPSRQELSILTDIQTSGASSAIESLRLTQSLLLSRNVPRSEAPVLCFENLRPCMKFSNLRHINLAIGWNVDLTDSDLLTLTLAWPRLETLSINSGWGWNTPRGVTPNGLLQLLHTCRSLSRIALVIDTRSYTELPSSGSLASLGLTLPPRYSINLLDSIIEAESVPAIVAFFVSIAPCSDISLAAWHRNGRMVKRPRWEEYRARWDDVCKQVKDAVSRRS
ncbi:hypothetical protein OG21DRAFT_1514508 [Imleria badia]|nr:hypothetical protein OG21DRAFT_1514508 [Imleria badia]